jgi:Tfp pilus assembly protein PilV
MRLTRAKSALPSQEDGFALIEVLVSALIAVIIAGAVMTLLQSSARSAADSRKRSQAYAIAQEDQARMRAMRIPSLHKYTQTRTVTVAGIPYTVESNGKYINDTSGSDPACGTGTTSVDYVKISSKVTWPGMRTGEATTIQGLIAPPSGTLNAKAGTLVINAANAAGAATAGIGVSGSGAGTFNGTTTSSGCLIFLEQASGEYTMTISGVGAGLVDQDGLAPAAKKVKVSPEVTNTVNLLYDKPGNVPIKFTTRGYNGSVTTAFTDAFIAFNTGMTTAKLYGTVEGTEFSEKTANSLFPFTSADSFYAGTCTANNPQTGLAIVNQLVPNNGTSAAQTIQMPPLYLNVSKESTAYNGAEVVIRDNYCENAAHEEVKRKYTTQSTDGTAGRLADPGLPWSQYSVCASLPIKVKSTNVNYREIVNAVKVESTTGTTLNMSITTEDEAGTCP